MLCTDICMQDMVKLELEDQTPSPKENVGLNLQVIIKTVLIAKYVIPTFFTFLMFFKSCI